MKAKSWGIVVVTAGAVIAVAALVELAFPCLDGAHETFYAACAQIAPIFALALFVEVAFVMAPAVADGADDAVKATVRTVVRLNVVMLLISEAAALFAAGSGGSSAFLTICSVLPWAVQILLLVDALYHRVGLSRFGMRQDRS